jgi:hypothetical protein
MRATKVAPDHDGFVCPSDGATASKSSTKELWELDNVEEQKPLVAGAAESGWGKRADVDASQLQRNEEKSFRHTAFAAMAASELSKKTKSISSRSKTTKMDDMWDVFLSYRAASDQKLVQDIYWRLVATDVMVDGKSRKMKPFWDLECLKSGESWEVGFKNAIIRSTVIVPVFSRKAFVNVPKLTVNSPCDNVILEYELALAMVISFCTLPTHSLFHSLCLNL